MTEQRFVFDNGKDGLAWVNVKGNQIEISKKDLAFSSYEVSMHTLDDVDGQAKLADEAKLLKFIALNLNQGSPVPVGSIKKTVFQQGEYMPRIWRGHRGNPFMDQYDLLQPHVVYGRYFTSAVVAAESLFKEVGELFRYIEPEHVNYPVYSHRLRELLILLCTEIEANWKAVHDVNFPSRGISRYSTKDYVLVKKPLRLDEYKACLKDYPHCEFAPFFTWTESSPTSSLPWYDAYNAVKHDRQGNFSQATFENVLNACAALHILQEAQWGSKLFDLLSYGRFSIYRVEDYPKIPIEEVYSPTEGTESDFSISRPYESV